MRKGKFEILDRKDIVKFIKVEMDVFIDEIDKEVLKDEYINYQDGLYEHMGELLHSTIPTMLRELETHIESFKLNKISPFD